jgi:hypothetical protein
VCPLLRLEHNTLSGNAEPILESVFPTLGPTRGSTVVTITGSNFVDGSTVCRAGQGSWTVASCSSSMECICTLPAHSQGRYPLSVSADGGLTFSKDTMTFLFYCTRQCIALLKSLVFVFSNLSFLPDQETITHISPSSGSEFGQTTVRVFGSNFINSLSLKCRFGTTVVFGTWQSSAVVDCSSPSKPGGTEVIVSVSNNGFDFPNSEVLFLYSPEVRIFSLLPSAGSETGGTKVAIVGSSFLNTSSLFCRFGYQETPALYLSSTSIECQAPRANPGPVVLEVTTNHYDFSSSGRNFLYLDVLRLDSIVPSVGPSSGGTVVSLSGASVIPSSGIILCRLEKKIFTASLVSPHTLIFTTSEFPAGTLLPVEVSINGVDYDNTFLSFMFVNPVTVISASPNVSTVGRPSIVISGENFVRTQMLKCSYGFDIQSDAVFVSSTVVECAQPPNLTGENCIAIALNGVQFSETCARIRIVPQPSIFSVAPSVASAQGASVIFLNGSGFVTNSSSFCRFNSILSPSFVHSPSSCSCVVPPGLLGQVRLDYSVNGLDYANSDIFISILEESIVFSVSPSSGPVAGGTLVSVSGINFATVNATCRFGNTVVATTEATPTKHVCESPPSEPSTIAVDVGTIGQSYTQNSVKFNYLVVPFISSIYPSVVPTSPGSVVTVYGSSFVPSQMICKIGTFDPFAVSFFVSSTTLIFETPAMLPGTYDFAVSYNGADFTSPISIIVIEDVNATQCYPSIASVRGGISVSVIGNNFLDSARLMCVYGDVLVSSSWINSTAILCKTPESVLPGVVLFSIYFPGGQRRSTAMSFVFHGSFFCAILLACISRLTLFCSCARNFENRPLGNSK